MMRRRGGRVIQYDPYVGTEWDLGHGVGRRPGWRGGRYGRRRRVSPVLIGLLALALLAFYVVYFFF